MLLLPAPNFNGYEIEAKVSLPFLPKVRSIHIYGEMKHGNQASKRQLDYYYSLAQDDFPSQTHVDDCAYSYFQKVAAIVDVRDFGLSQVSRENIDKHYRIELVTVPPIRNSSDRWLVLGGQCDWDPEHGIQFIVKNSRVIHTGESDGVFQGAGWELFLNGTEN